jgi:hypothetical protein
MPMSERGALGNLASRGKRAPMDHMLITPKAAAPAYSWWMNAPREGWQDRCDREVPRMRSAKVSSTVRTIERSLEA